MASGFGVCGFRLQGFGSRGRGSCSSTLAGTVSDDNMPTFGLTALD